MAKMMHYEKISWSEHRTPSLLARSMFYYVTSAGHFICSPTYRVDRRNYNVMLLVLTLKGKGYLTYNGKKYELTKGCGFLIDCDKPHIYESDSKESWELVWIHFSGCQSKEYEAQIAKNNATFFIVKENSIILKNILSIHNMIREKNVRLDLLGSCKILESMTEILGYCSDFKEEQIPEYIKKACSLIENKYAERLTLQLLTQDLYISKSYFIRLFKKYTGQSPYEYLMNYRLNEAKKLLKTSEAPIYEIASHTGFESVSHFIKLFNKHEHMTPLKFRNYWRD